MPYEGARTRDWLRRSIGSVFRWWWTHTRADVSSNWSGCLRVSHSFTSKLKPFKDYLQSPL